MQIASLGSGSKGNATLLRHQDTLLLIDCGFSLKQFSLRLERLELDPSDIDAVLLTHEHSDHSGGVLRLCKRFQIPLLTSTGTARAVLDAGFDYQVLVADQAKVIGAIEVMPITVPHDANEPLQFVFRQIDNGKRLGILTDTGHITAHITKSFDGLDGLLLEFNYDKQMLDTGPYPYSLKQRVSGQLGHLSNEQSMGLLHNTDISGLNCLIAAHVSEKNNAIEKVSELMAGLAQLACEPIIASQAEGFDWIQI